MNQTYNWQFPLPRTHAGMLMGNGVLGAMVWGGDNVLKVTLGRADWWDHRSGKRWTPEMNYSNLRRLLEANDEPAIRKIFAESSEPGRPRAPTVLPVGRVEIILPAGCVLTTGTLHLGSGHITLQVRDGQGAQHAIRLDLAMSDPLVVVDIPPAIAPTEIRRVSAWEFMGKHLSAVGFDPPEQFDLPEMTGWTQATPEDAAVCVGYRMADGALWLTADRGHDPADARAEAATLISRGIVEGVDRLRSDTAAWWREYWSDVPTVDLPNHNLAFLYHYGMYKFAGLTHPRGVAATLQGPWIEEYQMPPWSSDYHFNINVQMCYWPAYQGNRLKHLRPLFKLIWSWRERLRENARLFIGIDDGYLLPHSVDDRGQIIGAFWTGTIDHACTAWVGKMMHDYYLYTGDVDFLREVAYPFMHGAMRVYEEMLEDDGITFSLPVSVSPEYRGAEMNAWGRNASFQLAAIHWLVEALSESAKVLGETPRPIWADIARRLPRANVDPGPRKRILLWDNTPLEESHRHHSHLAGIAPFDVIDPADPEWTKISANSMIDWIHKGMGLWSGWCMPWAAMLHVRFGNADMAELVLDIWQRVFTNDGHGTLHDFYIRGFTLMGPETGPLHHREIMQMDAGMGVTAAVIDMLVHVRRGVVHLFPGAPLRWRNVAFENIGVEGGHRITARRENGVVTELIICPGHAKRIRIRNPWNDARGAVLDLDLSAGQPVSVQTRP